MLTLFGNNFLDGYTTKTVHYGGLGTADEKAAYKSEVTQSDGAGNVGKIIMSERAEKSGSLSHQN